MTTTKRVLFYFPKSETEKPIVYQLVKDYDLMVNIFRAKVTPDEEGYLLLDITGKQPDIDRAYQWIRSLGVQIREDVKGMRWDRDKCTSCGACITQCPTGALHIPNRKTMKVEFNSENCIECMNCIPLCPFGACTSQF
ncbi:MAG TPA: 4Fe-4S dicluster domain-containing protein [Spirochaetales bacterium]|jgi:ferredoxin|nr:4Fe-4S dicluster domain-containing protein [Spirochaetales bacterium]HOV37150.1 4Fe-4S dicluster domain-containing protein [Spirochaetales bacterium]